MFGIPKRGSGDGRLVNSGIDRWRYDSPLDVFRAQGYIGLKLR